MWLPSGRHRVDSARNNGRTFTTGGNAGPGLRPGKRPSCAPVCCPAGGGVRRARRLCSSASVMSVVAADRTAVAATMVTTAHSGRWAAAGADGGGGGGTGSVTAPPGGGRGRPGRRAPRPGTRWPPRQGRRPTGGCAGCRVPRGAAAMVRCGESSGWLLRLGGGRCRMACAWCPHRQDTAGGLELPWDLPGPAAWNRPGPSAGLVVEWSKAAGPGGWVEPPGGVGAMAADAVAGQDRARGVRHSRAAGGLQGRACGAAGRPAAAGRARAAAARGEPGRLAGPAGRGHLGRAPARRVGHHGADLRLAPAPGAGAGPGPGRGGRGPGDPEPRVPAARRS